MESKYKQVSVDKGVIVHFNENDYIEIGEKGNNIIVKRGDNILEFISFNEMVRSFKPGLIQKSRNLEKLLSLKFDEITKNRLFKAKVYDLEEMCSYKLLIIARNIYEAELLLDNYVIDWIGEAESDPIYELDENDIDESLNKYIEDGIGVYDLDEEKIHE